jgi:hypothetical protein
VNNNRDGFVPEKKSLFQKESHSQYYGRLHYKASFQVPSPTELYLLESESSPQYDVLKKTKKEAQRPVLSFLNTEMAEGRARKTPIGVIYWYSE